MRSGFSIVSLAATFIAFMAANRALPAVGDSGEKVAVPQVAAGGPQEFAEAQSLRDRLRERFGGAGGAWANRAAQSGAEHTLIAGRRVDIWRPASDQVGAAPLIVFSHGYRGCSTQSTFLTSALATHGYVVVAPVHADASCNQSGASTLGDPPQKKFRDYESWTDATYRDRAQDIVAVIDGLKADAHWRTLIDWSRIGLMGHSLGGYTVLGLSGGWPSWRLDGIKATLALSPYCQPFLARGDLRHLHVPTMYQGGTRDFGVTPFVKKPGGCFEKTEAPAYFVEFTRAGHLAWTDFKKDYQESVTAYSIAFFDEFLAGESGTDLMKRRSDVSVLKAK
jgi:predicted dienelactone hydrolase